MRKHHTNTVEIIINEGRPRRFVGPRNKLRLVKNILAEMNFEPAEDSKPWRQAFKEEIIAHGEEGLALKGARLKGGLTQQDLAKKLGIAQYNLSKMENGSRPIGKNMAKKLSKILNVDYRVFL